MSIVIHPGGNNVIVADGITETASYDIVVDSPFNSLLVIHDITGTKSGHVSLTLSPDGIVAVPHHGSGANIPSGNVSAAYSCVFNAVAGLVTLTVTVNTGTHTVWVAGLTSSASANP